MNVSFEDRINTLTRACDLLNDARKHWSKLLPHGFSLTRFLWCPCEKDKVRIAGYIDAMCTKCHKPCCVSILVNEEEAVNLSDVQLYKMVDLLVRGAIDDLQMFIEQCDDH